MIDELGETAIRAELQRLAALRTQDIEDGTGRLDPR